jgi:hypothetical protein
MTCEKVIDYIAAHDKRKAAAMAKKNVHDKEKFYGNK